MIARACIDCSRIVPAPARRCPEHHAAWTRARGQRPARRLLDTRAWRNLSARVRREHPWCTKCGAGDTPENPLTADHIIPRAAGGQNVRSNVQVLCRSCNLSLIHI